MTITVVPRETHHEAELLRALERTYAASGYPVEGPDAFPTWLHPTGLHAAWTALRQGVPIGQVCLTRDLELCRLYIDPQAQGLGAGSALIKTVMEHVDDVHLTVLDKDTTAIRLYQHLGWQPTSRTTNGAHHGTIYRWKKR